MTMPTRGSAPPIATALAPGLPGPLYPLCACQAYWQATAPPCRYVRPAGPLHPFCVRQAYWRATAPPLCAPGILAGHCTPLPLRAPGGATAPLLCAPGILSDHCTTFVHARHIGGPLHPLAATRARRGHCTRYPAGPRSCTRARATTADCPPAM